MIGFLTNILGLQYKYSITIRNNLKTELQLLDLFLNLIYLLFFNI